MPDRSVLEQTIYLKCPHWDNDFHTNWKIKSGLMNIELTAPGEPEHSLWLCPVCANLVRARVFEELLTKNIGINTPQWNTAVDKSIEWALEKRAPSDNNNGDSFS